MPNGRNSGQRIRSGLYAAGALTSTYEVSRLAVQSDQPLSIPWGIDSFASRPPIPARITTNADLSRTPDGFYEFDWVTSYHTFGMFGYWVASFLPADVESADVTVMTYDEEDAAMYLQALIHRPHPGDGMTAVKGGWGDIHWRFTRGVAI